MSGRTIRRMAFLPCCPRRTFDLAALIPAIAEKGYHAVVLKVDIGTEQRYAELAAEAER